MTPTLLVCAFLAAHPVPRGAPYWQHCANVATPAQTTATVSVAPKAVDPKPPHKAAKGPRTVELDYTRERVRIAPAIRTDVTTTSKRTPPHDVTTVEVQHPKVIHNTRTVTRAFSVVETIEPDGQGQRTVTVTTTAVRVRSVHGTVEKTVTRTNTRTGQTTSSTTSRPGRDGSGLVGGGRK